MPDLNKKNRPGAGWFQMLLILLVPVPTPHINHYILNKGYNRR